MCDRHSEEQQGTGSRRVRCTAVLGSTLRLTGEERSCMALVLARCVRQACPRTVAAHESDKADTALK
uniref:Uncharacterized protein n=1 Tax=Oryza sativa subsp. japonica TaxID=39947 RepID=Q6YW68_ORYSJ|nr:hypothetical protein [Oryza sativa Japonica Group]